MTASNGDSYSVTFDNRVGGTPISHGEAVPYQVSEHILCAPRRLRVACIGAGASGIMMCYKKEKEFGDSIDLVVYERYPKPGGVWYANKYPGCRCDVPSPAYQYPFHPKADWSRYYSPAAEIQSYYESFARERGYVDNYIKLSHRVDKAAWDEITGQWVLTITETTGPSERTFEDRADFLVANIGVLNTWKWPDIPNREAFHGNMTHSADYDTNLDLEGKTVIVIGSGASAIQIVPAIKEKAKKVISFYRTPQWIGPGLAMDGFTDSEGRNFTYTEEQKNQFSQDPVAYLAHRKAIETKINASFPHNIASHPAQKMAREFVTERMKRILKNDKTLTERLVPTFPMGCRRLGPAEGFLEAFHEDNVELAEGDIESFTEDGLRTTDGTEFKADVIICATGFNVSFKPHFPIIGRDQVSLSEAWKNDPAAYLALTTSGFPNFMIGSLGPNCPAGHGSFITVLEAAQNYVCKIIRKIQTENILSMEVKPEVVAEYNEHVHEWLKRTVWAAGCRSWYNQGRPGGKITAQYPGSLVHWRLMLEHPRFEHYDIRYRSSNRFEFMGNGFTLTEVDGGDLACTSHSTATMALPTHSDGVYGHYPLHDRSQRPLDVIVVGAGPSGIAALIELKKLPYVKLKCFEKNHDVGGTWLETRYPGAACDVASHAYQYSFDSKTDWSRHFAPAEEIGEYFISVAKKHALLENITFNSRVVGAEWDETEAIWRVQVAGSGSSDWHAKTVHEEYQANVFINAGGILNDWKWPEIEGLHGFKGKLLHTAAWDPSVDLEGASVGVIGSGASSIQVVPSIQPMCRNLDVYVRSPTYILPTVGFGIESSAFNELYTSADIDRFNSDPEYYMLFRKQIEQQMNENFAASVKDSTAEKKGREWATKMMRSAIASAELREKLVPSWELGCRRLTPSLPYLKAIQQPNVNVIRTGIRRITETGVETEDGKTHNIDVLICATGFNTSFSSRFNIIGRRGISLRTMWKDRGPEAYLGMAIAGLPNYFTILGPNCPIANGSLIPCIEWSAKYIAKAITKMQTDQIRSIDVKQPLQDAYNDYVQDVHKDLVWTGSCNSWYKDRKSGRVVAVWPGSSIHFMEMIESPRWEDFNIEYIHSNPFSFMGNGISQREAQGQDLTFYLDNMTSDNRIGSE
ncbi:hypothetical protein CkaCkLH20_05649 [Colletotrichum karsti]|uniref:Sterigmatocystin biosynthesis monooxygenase stcW n=1 Tax=Colletotrichum karsti TaxID=1095194 RepID=A0A9P6I3S8_9PEZI|nr:uncharacterized protein CkaCkLH20_05649 [Colletotrichum karsti]KAF9876803.1 hypothetical protein CkaCkLH20_05649 [Colletotrichum karsti]